MNLERNKARAKLLKEYSKDSGLSLLEFVIERMLDAEDKIELFSADLVVIARKANAIENESTDPLIHALAVGIYTIAKRGAKS